jgi:hypothetical protein
MLVEKSFNTGEVVLNYAGGLISDFLELLR